MYICVIVSTVDVNDCIFSVNEQQKVYYMARSASGQYAANSVF